jgi:hypothetical protein
MMFLPGVAVESYWNGRNQETKIVLGIPKLHLQHQKTMRRITLKCFTSATHEDEKHLADCWQLTNFA